MAAIADAFTSRIAGPVVENDNSLDGRGECERHVAVRCCFDVEHQNILGRRGHTTWFFLDRSRVLSTKCAQDAAIEWDSGQTCRWEKRNRMSLQDAVLMWNIKTYLGEGTHHLVFSRSLTRIVDQMRPGLCDRMGLQTNLPLGEAESYVAARCCFDVEHQNILGRAIRGKKSNFRSKHLTAIDASLARSNPRVHPSNSNGTTP